MSVSSTTKGEKPLRRRLWAVAAVAMTVGVACQYWEWWDEVFNRSQGWFSSDGGSTVVLPGNRLLWVFGDTVTAPLNTSNPFEPTGGSVYGNTLGLHAIGNPKETPPNPSAATFWARTKAGGVTNISTSAPDRVKFFRYKTCSGWDDGAPTLWPGDGTMVGSSLFFMTWKLEFDTAGVPVVAENVFQKNTGVTSSNLPSGWTCSQSGVVHPPRQYGSPVSAAEVFWDPPLVWGVAIYRHSNGWNYIFGHRKQPGSSAGELEIVDAVVAKATDADIFDYTKWLYRYNEDTTTPAGSCSPTARCWLNHYPNTVSTRDALRIAAVDVGPEFSVDKITHTEQGPFGPVSGTRFVMVHGAHTKLLNQNGNDFQPGSTSHLYPDYQFNFRVVVVRSVKDQLDKWPGPGQGDTSQSGSTARADILAKQINWPGYGSVGPLDRNTVTGYNAYRSIHAIKGHGAISAPGNIMISYNVWRHWVCTDGTCDNPAEDTTMVLGYTSNDVVQGNYVSPFRFAQIPLRVVEPWCQAHFSGDCQYP